MSTSRPVRPHNGRIARSRAPWLLVAGGLCLLSGCTLLDVSRLLSLGTADTGGEETHTALLKKLPVPPDAVVLEILLVERPASDPLLGDTLWREVDEIAALDLSTRQVLRKNGIRVGRVGANPPRALQTLLGLSEEIGADAADRRLSSQTIVRPSGAEAQVTASEVRLLRNLTVVAADGTERPETLDNARCVLRLRPRKLQDGWARVEFLPEVHHGEFANRATATTAGWQMKTTQEVEKLYDQQFSMDLNLGEMVVLTAGSGPEYSLGANFFRGLGEDKHLQRLLVIRLADLNRAELVYAE